jgi:hypothetical protein
MLPSSIMMFLSVFRGLLTNRAPSQFRSEGSLCYFHRVEVGPLLCESLFRSWCCLLLTPCRSSPFDTEFESWCQDGPVHE